MTLWQAYLRPWCLKSLARAGLTPLAYRLTVSGDVRRRARRMGLKVDVARDGTITNS